MSRAKRQNDPRLPPHESAVRRLVADANEEPYEAFSSLAAAREVADAVVVLEGDYGGQIYVVAPMRYVKCAEPALKQLLLDLDAVEWADPTSANVYFERLPVGAGVLGGMGGAAVVEGVWIHKRLEGYTESICAVLAGQQERVAQ